MGVGDQDFVRRGGGMFDWVSRMFGRNPPTQQTNPGELPVPNTNQTQPAGRQWVIPKPTNYKYLENYAKLNDLISQSANPDMEMTIETIN